MFEQLFGSKTRVKLLKLFYNNPDRPFYVREITRKIKEQINSVRRELANLVSAGVVKGRQENNRLYYNLNESFEFYGDFKNIFTKDAANVSDEDKITKRIRSIGRVHYAVLTGFFTSETKSPVDLFLVGDINKTKLNELLSELEKENGREVNYSIMSLEEYNYRSMLYDKFLTEITESRKIVIVDEVSNTANASKATEVVENEPKPVK